MGTTSNNRFVRWFMKHPGRNIVAIVVLALALIYASVVNSTFNDGNRLQNKITALETNIHTSISTCLDNTRISAQIAEEEFDSIKEVLTEVVGARYKDNSSADAALQGGALVSVLVEQYPDIDQTTWKLVMSEAVGCRKDVKDDQNRQVLAIKELKDWTQTGSIFTKMWHSTYPDDKLYVRNPKTGEMLYGQRALEYFENPITTKEAKEAVKNREMPEQDISGGR